MFYAMVFLIPGDATLSRHSFIDISQLALQGRIAANHSGEVTVKHSQTRLIRPPSKKKCELFAMTLRW